MRLPSRSTTPDPTVVPAALTTARRTPGVAPRTYASPMEPWPWNGSGAAEAAADAPPDGGSHAALSRGDRAHTEGNSLADDAQSRPLVSSPRPAPEVPEDTEWSALPARA